MKILGLGFFDRVRELGLMDLLDPEKKFDGFLLNAVCHLIEHIKSLALILHKRIALAVGPEPDPFAEIIEAVKMLFPFCIDHLEQDKTPLSA